MKRPTELTTGKARLSFCHILEPYVRPDDPSNTPKYSVTIIIPKADRTTKAAIDRAYQFAVNEGIQQKWGGKKPALIACPIYDGDGVRPNGEPFGEECKGSWVLTASSKRKPLVVDAALQDIIDANEIYSGIYGKVGINFFAYYNAGKKGIGCGLNGVQKVADGEALGGAAPKKAEDMFQAEAQIDPITGEAVPF